jgi:hypothetical protein
MILRASITRRIGLVLAADLQQKALLQVTGSHPGRIKILDYLKYLVKLLFGCVMFWVNARSSTMASSLRLR